MEPPIHHETAGAGPPVLLIHAGGLDLGMWKPQLAALGSRQVVRCDLRGHGRTPAAESPYSDVDDLASLLDALGIGRCAVVGASFGGYVALQLALAHPERVERLVLADPALDLPDWSAPVEAFRAEEERLLEAGDVDGAVELGLRTWLGAGASAEVRDAVAAMQRRAFELQLGTEEVEASWPPERPLSALTVPTLVVVGASDFPDFHRIARIIESEAPDARVEVIEGAAHLPSLEAPEAFNEALRRFL